MYTKTLESLDTILQKIDATYVIPVDTNDLSFAKDWEKKIYNSNEKNEILSKTIKEFNVYLTNLSKYSYQQRLFNDQKYHKTFIFVYMIREYYKRALYTQTSNELKEYITKNIYTKKFNENLNENIKTLSQKIKSIDFNDNKLLNKENMHLNCKNWSNKELKLVCLGNWFNINFFKWKYIICSNCNIKCDDNEIKVESISDGNIDLCYIKDKNKKEILNKCISRIHVFQCKKCKKLIRFERFNKCLPLLMYNEYRNGLCGEHCDAFAGLINTMNYKWRYALDDTDHVWLEIYNNNNNKWMRFEPSPDMKDCRRLDNNQLYINRKSQYIIGISKDKLIDITFNYQKKDVLIKRRKEYCIKEEWIQKFIQKENEIYFTKL